ncbi:MAG: hypothetical protein PW734_06200 [Verrucomicrobium sp.]|nr:hypothetical protein [Verrucomicrobium sp.]
MILKPLAHSAAAMAALALLASCLVGCANTTTTKVYRDAKGAWVVESPKDIEAQGIDLSTAQGTRLKVDKYESHPNAAVTAAQGAREASDVDAASTLVGAAVSAAVRGQMQTTTTAAH